MYANHIVKMVHECLSHYPPHQLHVECKRSSFILSERHFPQPQHTQTRKPMVDIILFLHPESAIATLESLLIMLASSHASTTTELSITCDVLDPRLTSAFNGFVSFLPAVK